MFPRDGCKQAAGGARRMEAAGEARKARTAAPVGEEPRAKAPGDRRCSSSAEEAALEVRWGPAGTA